MSFWFIKPLFQTRVNVLLVIFFMLFVLWRPLGQYFRKKHNFNYTAYYDIYDVYFSIISRIIILFSSGFRLLIVPFFLCLIIVSSSAVYWTGVILIVNVFVNFFSLLFIFINTCITRNLKLLICWLPIVNNNKYVLVRK